MEYLNVRVRVQRFPSLASYLGISSHANCALHEMEPEANVNALQNVEREELFRVIKDVSKRLDPNSYTNMLCALSGVIDSDVYEKIVDSQVNYWRGLSQSLENDLKLLEAHQRKLYETYSIPVFPDGYERRKETVPILNASSSRQTGTVALSTPEDLERSDDVRKSVKNSPIFIDLGESSDEIEGSKTVNENVGSASVKMCINLSGTVNEKGLRENLYENAVISGFPSASGRASREHGPKSNRESAKKSKKRRWRQRKRRRNQVNNNLGVSQENVTTSHGREPPLPHPLVICALPAHCHHVESRTGNNISWMAAPRL